MISMNYPIEPAVDLPDNIKTVAVANRSVTPKEDKASKIIESIITGEIEVSDRKASEQCLAAVSNRITEQDGFRIVYPEKYKLNGTGTREIPAPLDWKEVEDICSSSNADALLVLEMFDSNSDMFALPKILFPRPVDNERTFNILMYWRMYDPASKKIVDQYECSRVITFHGDGNGVAVPPKALHGAAYSGGMEYIERLLPGYFIVNRVLYKKGKGAGKEAFKSAYRHVETNDWEGAADTWEEILKNDSFENRGRACLNMAVYFEQVGNREAAIEYARRSYVDYGIKEGRDYEFALRQL